MRKTQRSINAVFPLLTATPPPLPPLPVTPAFEDQIAERDAAAGAGGQQKPAPETLAEDDNFSRRWISVLDGHGQSRDHQVLRVDVRLDEDRVPVA
ncbi:MAG: hypothetical protein AAF937_10060 [Planctomycetota bacterium]